MVDLTYEGFRLASYCLTQHRRYVKILRHFDICA